MSDQGLLKDWAVKLEEFREQCDQGLLEGCHSLGQYYELIERDYPRAAQLYSANCENPKKRYGLSCFSMATMYIHGLLDGGQPRHSVPYFEKSCAMNLSQACHNLGVIYSKGLYEVDQDWDKGLKFFSRGCEANGENSCFSAGAMLLRRGQDADKPDAMLFFEKACFQGNPMGCANVSIMLARGDGVPADSKRAAEFKEMAKELGRGYQ